MPVFIAKYNEHREEIEAGLGEGTNLLGTIKIPRNLSHLTAALPKAQYDKEDEPSSHKQDSELDLPIKKS